MARDTGDADLCCKASDLTGRFLLLSPVQRAIGEPEKLLRSCELPTTEAELKYSTLFQ